MPHTLATLFSHYLTDTQLDHAPSTHYQQRVFYAKILRDLGAVPLEDVTPDLLRTWKAHLTTHYARSTVHRYMAFVNCALRYAVECEWLTVNPMAKVRKPSPGRGRVRFLTHAERHRLLLACQASRNPCLYPIVLLALSTGGRKNEVRGLCWPDVDFACGVVRFLRTKTDEPRAVPLLGEARRVLEARAQTRHPRIPWVFPRADGRKPRDIECAWTTARQHAGLTDFRFHDLRHTFASYMAMSGASLREIAEALGHRKLQQTMQYSHLLQSHTHGVIERMIHAFLLEPSANDPEMPSGD